MRILHVNGFSEEEKRQKIEDIKKNIRDAILTITGAMSTLVPPVQLENSAHQWRVDYIQDVASNPDFDYPLVRSLLNCDHTVSIHHRLHRNFMNTAKFFGRIKGSKQPLKGPMNTNSSTVQNSESLMRNLTWLTCLWHSAYLSSLWYSFLDRVNVIKTPDYTPSEQDILRCRVLTSGIFETKFQVEKVNFQ